jgi:hypothetical protein
MSISSQGTDASPCTCMSLSYGDAFTDGGWMLINGFGANLFRTIRPLGTVDARLRRCCVDSRSALV